ncbi:MAG: aminotransferase class III-fold pyridoxal phosphate-dependent enzyme [Candidatus Methylacidiphilales bacterium]
MSLSVREKVLLPESMRLFGRAARVVPGGIYGHTAPALTVPGAMPYFAARAEGCRYWDVDGREYFDYMCGYGPIVLGYNHPEVEEAVRREQAKGGCFNHPTEVFVELAEALVSRIDFADWAVFGKNGSDMTTWAVQVAREHTRRKKILTVAGAYHGIDPWCTPGHGGLIEEDRMHVHSFEWNAPEALAALLERYRGQVAAVVLTPFHHPLYRDSILPDKTFVTAVNQLCREHGAVLVLDDVRAGFRLHPGGSHRVFGFEPDLACYCKAIGNGHPISATVGRDALRSAAGRVFLTGSFWNAPGPMAAALKTIQILESTDAYAVMARAGTRLMEGLVRAGAAAGFTVRPSGPPAMPFMTFEGDRDLRMIRAFARLSAAHGIFFHPHHNWFVCAAHRDEEIDETLERVTDVFRALPDELAG